jgi:hypothetical protein
MSKTTSRRAVSRRTMLRGMGVGLALPLLDVMAPVRAQTVGVPRRMFGICNNLGLLPADFFPAGAGLDYTPSPYLKILADHRKDFTVFSGVSHPNVDGGHPSDISFLTAAPHPASRVSSRGARDFSDAGTCWSNMPAGSMM